MQPGQIVLIPFPFAEMTTLKVRPAIVVTTTKDKYQDLILCAISSVVPDKLRFFEMIIQPNPGNGLRIASVIKVDRIVTLKNEDVIAMLGKISDKEILEFTTKFKTLVD